jgi:hypothetical protein
VSSASPSCAIDTVVLLYFLMVGEADLLVDSLGAPLGTPRIIYDPDEGTVPDAARSEMTRSIAYYTHSASDPSLDAAARSQATTNAKRLLVVNKLHRAGKLTVLDLTSAELETFGKVTSPSRCTTYGLVFPLSPGEAACLAIALARNLSLVTDDSDALRALRQIKPNHPYQRIRKLLIHAGRRGRITRARANMIHNEMTRLGFWDRELPYPDARR